MKRNKRKSALRSTLLLLLLTAILLISSTYAWFTANKSVQVSQLDVNVQAANGLQISTDAQDWKAVITSADILKANTSGVYAGAKNQLPTTGLSPVSSAGHVNSNGELEMFLGTFGTTESSGGQFVLSTDALSDQKAESGNYIAFDLFFKVNNSTTLKLMPGSGIKALSLGTETPGAANGLENSGRIAFIKQGNDTDVSHSTQIREKKAATVDSFKNFSAGGHILWEPNNNAHTSASIANAHSTYGIKSLGATASIPSYYGVKAGAGKDIKLKDGPDTPLSTGGQYLEEVTPTLPTGTEFAGQNDFITLENGLTKYRIYMWVEGQDVDCQDDASGKDIRFDLKLDIQE